MAAIEPGHVDQEIWKACAGGTVKIPALNSRVYYFPQGHAEQCFTPPDFGSFARKIPAFLCRIISVTFLADQKTDEVFAKIRLEPISGLSSSSPGVSVNSGEESPNSENNIASFAKVLTASDANNGGGFSVPRFCADSIFPPLNYKEDPPVQIISVKDIQGGVWAFRHIFRGTPRRHLLTTGWSKFVNQKNLVAGDSAVFIRNRNGELFVGVRRADRFSKGDFGRKNSSFFSTIKDLRSEEISRNPDFSRHVGRVSAESVVDAINLAEAGRVFEVIYYPKFGSPDFCVKEEVVNAAMKVFWIPGMRFKMAMETDDSSRVTWFLGTISSVVVADATCWPSSPWRLLQVTWDEPEVLQNVKRVNPWQVEVVSSTPQLQAPFISSTPQLQAPFPFSKRLRVSQNPELFNDGEATMCFPVTGLTNTVTGHLSPSLFSYNSFPAGMQGARHDPISVPSSPNLSLNRSPPVSYTDSLYSQNVVPKLSLVSTELNIGGTSGSESSSPESQGNMHSFSKVNNRISKSTSKVGGGAFQLFGKIIRTELPVGVALESDDCMEDATVACKIHGQAEYDGDRQPLDESISHAYEQLYNRLRA